MRHAITRLASSQVPDHFGLAYDMWAPVETGKPGQDDRGKRLQGKVPDEDRDPWFSRLERISVPDDYRHFYQVWEKRLAVDGSRAAQFQLSSRLLIGHGNAAPSEVGLTVHHTWGTPVIPGSALKGLLSQYMHTCYGPTRGESQDGADSFNPRLLEGRSEIYEARAPYQGPTWKEGGSVYLHGPGEIYRALFGAPDCASDRPTRAEIFGPEYTDDPGLLQEARAAVGAIRGGLIFHDALMIPGDDPMPYRRDVLTVHQKTYYDGREKTAPNDYDSPNPVTFMTVKPGTAFLLAISGPEDWTKFALKHLTDALSEWGVGGKTSAGYGRVDHRYWKNVVKPEDILKHASSGVYHDFNAWLAEARAENAAGNPAMTARERLEWIALEWLEKLKALSPMERQEVSRSIRGATRSRKLKGELARLLEQLQDTD